MTVTVSTEENVPSSEAAASTSTGEMVINYSLHLHPQAKKCWSVIVTSRLCFLITYFSLQMSSFYDSFGMNGTFRGKFAIFHSIFLIKLPKLYTIFLG